jgi:predicted protein tyrosine phosphatase
MPRIVVCPLSQVPATVSTHSASHLITLIKDKTRIERPATILADRHLLLTFDDIIEPMEGMVAPSEEHATALLKFVGMWDRKSPIVVHCFAGISRSTAAAFITLCSLRPDKSEAEIARALRAASRFASPNIRLVGFADRLLGRDGRMVSAIESIGRGADAFEGIPFILPIDDAA